MITFDIAGTGGFSVRVELLEQVDSDNNRSQLTATLFLISSKWRGINYWISGQVTGRSFSSNSDHVYIGALNTPAAVGNPWTFTVDHAPDGTGSVTVDLSLRGYTVDGNYGNGWKVEGSRTVALTPALLESAVSVTEGAVSTIAISRRNSSYSHLLHYEFGALQGFITDSGTVSETPVLCSQTVIPFSIPEDFYLQLPNEAEGICKLTCMTMDGDKQVGVGVETFFTVTVPQSYGPILTPTVTDINPVTVALTGDNTKAVRFMSKFYCTAQAQGRSGATVVALTVEGQPLPAQLDYKEKLIFRATDSRGYVTEVAVSLQEVPYVVLTVNGSCSRVSPTDDRVLLKVRGSCFRGDFGNVENTLTLIATVGEEQYSLTPTSSGDRYEARLQLENLGYKQTHTVVLKATDSLMEVETVLQLGRGVPVFDWGQQDFTFHVPITAPRINGIKNPALKAWPVGAVILMTPDPKDYIGGKWEQFTLPGIDLDAWRRIQGADILGTAKLGEMLLGTEE